MSCRSTNFTKLEEEDHIIKEQIYVQEIEIKIGTNTNRQQDDIIPIHLKYITHSFFLLYLYSWIKLNFCLGSTAGSSIRQTADTSVRHQYNEKSLQQNLSSSQSGGHIIIQDIYTHPKVMVNLGELKLFVQG